MATGTIGRRRAAAGRPLGFDPGATIDRVVEIFWAHGYEGTTHARLEKSTALSRSSLLNTFGPKEQLFLAALDRYQERMETTLLAPLKRGSNGLTDLQAFFIALGKMKRGALGSNGCLLVTTASVFVGGSPPVAERVERFRRGLTEAFGAALERAVAAGEIGAATRAERVQVLVGLAVAVNWTARAAGGDAGHRLAMAATSIVEDWRLPKGRDAIRARRTRRDRF